MLVQVFKKGDSNSVLNTITDANGEAVLKIYSFPAILNISGLGYELYTQSFSRPPGSPLLVQLKPKANSLSEIVVTGVGRPTKLDEAVSVYKIISAADIKAQGAVTLQDALQNQLGIKVSQDAMLGGTINMQGMGGDNVKILVDGLPVNGREGQNIDLSTLNLSNVEKVEIAQGPMSVMYGSDALGGVINLITRSNPKLWQAAANAFYESTGKYNAGLHLAKKIKHHDLSIGGGRNFFKGWDPADSVKRDPLWRPKEQYFADLKYTYRFSDDASITFGSDYMNDLLVIKGGTENYSFYNRDVKDQYYTTQRWMNRLQAKWKTGKNGYWESNNSFSLYLRDRKSYITDLSDLSRKLSLLEGDQSRARFDDYTFRTTYNNKVGFFSYTFGYDINLEYSSGSDKIKGGNKYIGDYALLLITEFKFSPKLKLQPAIRGSYNSRYAAPLTPSFSLLYKPSAKYQIRASYATGFRAPTLKELYLDFRDSNHDLYGNPDLDPEKGNHIQVSTGYTLYQKGNNYNNITLTGYYNDVHNQIALAQAGTAIRAGTPDPYTYINIGHFKNLHLQLISQNQYQQFFVSLGGSFNHSIQTKTSIGYDYWEANVNFRYTFPKYHAGIALYYKYTGPAPLLITDITGQVNYQEGVNTHAYHNLDASVEKSFFRDKVQFVIGMKNLFNNTIIGHTGTVVQTPAAAAHGGSADGGMNLSTGRSFFASLKMQLYK
jgi:outer membrane receptor for ferrienterochelin and colicins